MVYPGVDDSEVNKLRQQIFKQLNLNYDSPLQHSLSLPWQAVTNLYTRNALKTRIYLLVKVRVHSIII
jgi:hypothetical protein